MATAEQSIFKKIITGQYRLKSFVCIAVLVVSFISFNAAFLIASYFYQRSFVKNADTVSDAIAHQILNSMLQLMQRG